VREFKRIRKLHNHPTFKLLELLISSSHRRKDSRIVLPGRQNFKTRSGSGFWFLGSIILHPYRSVTLVSYQICFVVAPSRLIKYTELVQTDQQAIFEMQQSGALRVQQINNNLFCPHFSFGAR